MCRFLKSWKVNACKNQNSLDNPPLSSSNQLLTAKASFTFCIHSLFK